MLIDVHARRSPTIADGVPAPLPTRADVEALIAECDLEIHCERLLASIRPAYRIDTAHESPHRIGGLPDFAPGESWPHDDRGFPYTLIAQIDASQLPSLTGAFPPPEWRHDGALLRIFAAIDARVEDIPALVLACPPDAPLSRATAVPPRPDPLPEDVWEPDDESLRELEAVPIHLTPALTVMTAWAAGLSDADSDDYAEFSQRLLHGGRPRGEEESWGTTNSSATQRLFRAKTRAAPLRGYTLTRPPTTGACSPTSTTPTCRSEMAAVSRS